MCCFSRKVEKVADTNIFARPAKDGRQSLVYQMTFSAREDLAMILPLPVPPKSKEDALRFINLEAYGDFFKDMRAGFPTPPPPRAAGADRGRARPEAKLAVVEVGSFEASFVPSVKDFARLDERFRLPAGVWDKLPQYKDWGFAVFKLKSGSKKVHPMAFEFPRADPSALFFPTVHIHDGEVHSRAAFDHALYCQPGGHGEVQLRWEESSRPANLFMNLDKAKGLLDGDAHVYRKKLRGKMPNEDILV
jgi:hypothetical protein